VADVELSGEAAVVASRIRTIDRDLDQMEKDREDSIVRGLRAPSGAAVINKWGQDNADARGVVLLKERAGLVAQLRELVDESRGRPLRRDPSHGLVSAGEIVVLSGEIDAIASVYTRVTRLSDEALLLHRLVAGAIRAGRSSQRPQGFRRWDRGRSMRGCERCRDPEEQRDEQGGGDEGGR
jgi:hypothetical protein